jgi:starch-binding outer membrane protein SusE/F
MKKIIIFISIIGLAIYSCKKDETRAILSDTPSVTLIAPAFDVLKRGDSSKITFTGKSDFGFKASVTYVLQADFVNSFTNPITLGTSMVDTFIFKVSDFNSLLLSKGLTADTINNIFFRVSASVGSTVPTIYSANSAKSVTPYGLPKLLINTSTGTLGIINSSASNGIYKGYVKLKGTDNFTLKDPESGTDYGVTGGILAGGGTPLTVALAKVKNASVTDGWYFITANTNDKTFELDAIMIGVVGSATPNSWNAPDTKMDYDAKTGIWFIKMDLEPSLDNGVTKCEFKFRKNDDWGWNLGGTATSLIQGGANIVVSTPGVYTIKLTINTDGQTGSYTMTSSK